MIKKMLILIINFILLFSIVYNFSFISNAEFDIASKFGGDVSETGISDATDSAKIILATVLSIIRIAAAAVALVIIIVIACKYMLASAGDRADIKKYAINYVIGAFILFGASALVSIANEFVKAAMSTGG